MNTWAIDVHWPCYTVIYIRNNPETSLFNISFETYDQTAPWIRVVYKSQQPAKFTSFSARFSQLLSLLHESRYVQEMMFIKSHNCLLFTKLWLTKKLKENALDISLILTDSFVLSKFSYISSKKPQDLMWTLFKTDVAASKHQGQMKFQENYDRRKYHAKPGDTLQRHLINLINCKRI